MIVDLAHVPHLTQRRPDTPLNSLVESPLPDDVFPVQMPPEVAAPDASTDDNNAGPGSQSPNHLPADVPPPVPENSSAIAVAAADDEPPWNITGKESDADSNRGNVDETSDKMEESSSRPILSAAAAAHNLSKLIIPDDGVRKRRRVTNTCHTLQNFTAR